MQSTDDPGAHRPSATPPCLRGWLAALIGLSANVARADWGENWGEMTWGFPGPAVPGLGVPGLFVLGAALLGVALLALARRRAPRATLVMLLALAVPLTAWAATIGVPYTFSNGTPADADEVNANFDALVAESNAQDGRILTLESGHTHPGSDITSQVGDADTVDGVHAADLEESLEIDLDIATHSGFPSAHHVRYTDGEAQSAMGLLLDTNPLNHDRYTDADAFAAVTAVDGAGSNLDADLLDGMQASEIITAASNVVRTPVSNLPVDITSPGSYYLTGNLDGSTGGIDVLADDVTLDLMGFVIDGAGANDYGIDLTGRRGVTIRNGKIRGFGLSGIHQGSASADFNQVFGLQVLGNGTLGTTANHSGIYLAGDFNHVEHCAAGGNGGYGIFAGTGSNLASNTGDGISDSGCPSVPPGCPASHALRAPQAVFTELQAAIDAQDWTAFACNYATDAFDINDQGVLVGHNDLVAAEQSLSSLFNGISPSIFQVDAFNDTVRVVDSLDNGWVVIPDRMRTFVVECGIITRSATHGLLEFTGPPP